MRFSCASFLLLVLLSVSSGRGQTFTEFPLTAGVAPAGITAGPDGNVWFTEYDETGNKIGRITPEGMITEFQIPTAFAHPLGITTGPDGNLWFTENRGLHQIARITTSGEITEFPIPGGEVFPYGIATGPDGALWFTEDVGNKIVRITTSGSITEFPLPACERCNEARSGEPGEIVLGPDGALWFTEQSANQIGRITASGEISEFPIPTPDSYPDCFFDPGACGPISIAAGPDGALWFTEYNENKIGRITTSGEITEFPIPTPGSAPWDIVAGLDGNLYFTERTGGKIGRITTSGEITEFPVPTPGSKPQGITLGPDGAIWFTIQGPAKIGRLSLEGLTCESDATTLCLNAGRFRLTADWRKPDGTTGHGQAVSLTPDSGYFWFFNPANIEAVVKVLNACAVNDHHWVFAAGLTNVEVTLRVVDTQTDSLKAYMNPLGTAFQPIQDTSTFATCP